MVVVFVFSSFTACGSNTEKKVVQETKEVSTAVYTENGLPKDQQVTLKVGFAEAGYGRAYYDHEVATFTKKFPNVKFETTYSPKIDTLVQVKAQANNDEDMFDLIMVPSLQYAQAGKLEPIGDLFERTLYDAPDKKVKDMFVKGLWESVIQDYEGKYYSLPGSYWVGGLFYDKNFFKENGWNENPNTYAEFLKLCEDIKAKGVDPITFSGLYNYLTFAVWMNKGFEIAEMNNTLDAFTQQFRNYKLPQYSAPEMVEAYKRVYDMGKKGYFAKGLPTLNHTQSQMAVIQRKAAMVCTADWVENEMKDATPAGFEWGYMALPFVNDPKQTIWVMSGSSDNFVLWAGKPDLNKKWAKEFLLWSLNLDCQKEIVKSAGAMSVRKDFADNPENLKDLSSVHKSIFAYFTNHNVRLETGLRKTTPKFGPSYSQASTIFKTSTSLIAEGKKDPEAIMKECESYLEKAIIEGEKLK